MKFNSVLFSGILSAVILSGCAIKSKSTVIDAPTASGELEVVSGEVLVESANGKIIQASEKQKIITSDTIITGKNARTKIVMADHNELHVAPGSQVEIKKYEDDKKGKVNVLIKLLNGKVRANVRQKYDGKEKVFQIQTPTAVAGVRGTEFTTSFDEKDSSSKIVALDGVVEFGQPGPNGTILNAVNIAAGETSTSVGGSAPSAPVKLPAEKLNEVNQESNVEAQIAPVLNQVVTAADLDIQSTDANVALRWLRNGNVRFVKRNLRSDGQSKADILKVSKWQHPHSIVLTCSDSRVPPEIIFDQKLGEIFVIRTLDAAPEKNVITAIESALTDFHPRLLLVLGHAACANVLEIAEKIKANSNLIRQAAEKNQILVKTAIYDLNTGIVNFN